MTPDIIAFLNSLLSFAIWAAVVYAGVGAVVLGVVLWVFVRIARSIR